MKLLQFDKKKGTKLGNFEIIEYFKIKSFILVMTP
jgi:hypothetical protein